MSSQTKEVAINIRIYNEVWFLLLIQEEEGEEEEGKEEKEGEMDVSAFFIYEMRRRGIIHD
jgi:hypothetical protein